MEKGDCLYFSGETSHQVRSLGRQKAEVLVVIALAQPDRASRLRNESTTCRALIHETGRLEKKLCR
jgi:mannose-6-phosphate isomerase-like protein (cupin superfamily)